MEYSACEIEKKGGGGSEKTPKHLIYTMLKISVTTWHTGLLHDYLPLSGKRL